MIMHLAKDRPKAGKLASGRDLLSTFWVRGTMENYGNQTEKKIRRCIRNNKV